MLAWRISCAFGSPHHQEAEVSGDQLAGEDAPCLHRDLLHRQIQEVAETIRGIPPLVDALHPIEDLGQHVLHLRRRRLDQPACGRWDRRPAGRAPRTPAPAGGRPGGCSWAWDGRPAPRWDDPAAGASPSSPAEGAARRVHWSDGGPPPRGRCPPAVARGPASGSSDPRSPGWAKAPRAPGAPARFPAASARGLGRPSATSESESSRMRNVRPLAPSVTCTEPSSCTSTRTFWGTSPCWPSRWKPVFSACIQFSASTRSVTSKAPRVAARNEDLVARHRWLLG